MNRDKKLIATKLNINLPEITHCGQMPVGATGEEQFSHLKLKWKITIDGARFTINGKTREYIKLDGFIKHSGYIKFYENNEALGSIYCHDFIAFMSIMHWLYFELGPLLCGTDQKRMISELNEMSKDVLLIPGRKINPKDFLLKIIK